MAGRAKVAIAPNSPRHLVDAVEAGGGAVVDPADAEGLVWLDFFDPPALRKVLDANPGIRWVQLPSAGVERWAGMFDDRRTWTSAKGAYSEPVAEHALALALAGLRQFPQRARARSWTKPSGTSLLGGRVTIVGGGGITESLLRLLEPFGTRTTVVRRRPMPLDGADEVVVADRLHDALADADVVVLTLALTADTAGIIGAAELDRMAEHAWLVNVARGGHVVTDDLVGALREQRIGGAALDVTDPEPLPDGHALWDLDNCLITPHTANTWQMALPLLSDRVRANVVHLAAGEPLDGVIDPHLGY